MAPEKNQDLNLFYVGGHGGFFLLHLLLLSRKYACVFFNEHHYGSFDSWFLNFKENIYPTQWNQTDEWKRNEVYPDNETTLISDNYEKSKIFFTCNWIDRWKVLPGKKLVIYTDLETELRLSWYKKANVFFKNGYQDKIITIPESIQKAKTILRSSIIMDNKKHRKGMPALLDQCDIRINLHELINNTESVLFDNFGIEYNEDQKAHIDHWLSLHPKKLLEKTKLLRKP